MAAELRSCSLSLRLQKTAQPPRCALVRRKGALGCLAPHSPWAHTWRERPQSRGALAQVEHACLMRHEQ